MYENEEFAVDNLPEEIHKRVADFLNAPDVISFSLLCKKINNDLGVATFTDQFSYTDQIHENNKWYGEYDDKERVWCDLFPNIVGNVDKIHTIQFKGNFVDQGWGNRKGVLFVQEWEEKGGKKGPYIHVVTSPIAEHHEMKVDLTFRPKPGKRYSFSLYVGDGGGHELIVTNPQVRYLMYHDKNYVKAANLLLQQDDVLQLCQNNVGISMFMGVIDLFLQRKTMMSSSSANNDCHTNASLMKFIETIGLDVNDQNLLEEMKRFLASWQHFQNMLSAHAKRKKKKSSPKRRRGMVYS